MLKRRPLMLTTVMGSSGPAPVVYLFRDLFTTPRAAGAVNGTDAEPGPGTRAVVDSGGALIKIETSGKMELKGDTTWSNGTFSENTAVTRGQGVAVFFRVIVPNGASGAFGLSTSKTNIYLSGSKEYFSPTAPNFLAAWADGYGPLCTAGQEYEIAMILRTKGCHYLIRGGTEYPEWTHVYSSYTDSTATLYWVAEAYHANYWGYKDLRFIQMLAPFSVDYTFATQRVASASVGETLTHTADGHIELTWTAVTGQTLDIMFRRTDDNNCWIVRCDQANSKIYLYEKQGGTETERGATGGVAQTWTNSTAYRIIIRFWGQRIVTQVGTANKHTYTSAAFNATATGAKTDRAGANFIAWPWTLSGSALAEVVRVSGPF